MHVSDEAHDTPSKSGESPVGFGVGCVAHSLPFQYSASVSSGSNVLMLNPTLVQEVDEVHETPCARTGCNG
jgi:hypothetical protein